MNRSKLSKSIRRSLALGGVAIAVAFAGAGALGANEASQGQPKDPREEVATDAGTRALEVRAAAAADRAGLSLTIDGVGHSRSNLAKSLAAHVQQNAAQSRKAGRTEGVRDPASLEARRAAVADAMLMRLLALEAPAAGVVVTDDEVKHYIDQQRRTIAEAKAAGQLRQVDTSYLDDPKTADYFKTLFGATRLRMQIVDGSKDPRAAQVAWLKDAVQRHAVEVDGVEASALELAEFAGSGPISTEG